jgi:hypothetical protein
MATAEPSTSPVITISRPGRRLAWLLWICVTILGAVIASMVAWWLRSLYPRGPISVQELVAFIIAIETELLIATGQWLVLRRYQVPARWWIPASVAANVAAAFIIVPPIIGVAVAMGGIRPITVDGGLSYGMLSAVASGIVIGTAQALVLRGSGRKLMVAWIAATVLGGVLATVVTNALAWPLFDASARLPILGMIGLLVAVGALAASACQTPVLVRLLR